MTEYTYEIIESTNPLGEINKTLKRSDGAFIPMDEANSDYQAYLASLEEGEPKAE